MFKVHILLRSFRRLRLGSTSSICLLNQKTNRIFPRSVCGDINITYSRYFSSSSRPVLSSYSRLTIPKQLSEDYRLVYEGPLSKSVRYVKVFSLTTCLASLIGSPCLVFLGKESIALVGKMAVAGTCVLIGTSTTFLLHWITRVYIHRMFFNPIEKTFAVETMNLFARKKLTQLSVKDIIIPLEESGFSTFSANNNKYFIHMELPEAKQLIAFVNEINHLRDTAQM